MKRKKRNQFFFQKYVLLFIKWTYVYFFKKKQSLFYIDVAVLIGWLVGFCGLSTFVGNLTPNPFLSK